MFYLIFLIKVWGNNNDLLSLTKVVSLYSIIISKLLHSFIEGVGDEHVGFRIFGNEQRLQEYKQINI